ncbi:MAG: chromate reductase [Flavobacteriales bacterium]|jgi:chromate reductase
MKVLAFAASSSKNSINQKLVKYAASLVDGAEIELLDLNDFEMPIFSVDKEAEIGKHPVAQKFIAAIAAADALLISFAEHNGSYSAAYKNLFDWASRVEQKVYQGKPAVFLATSPGPGGARNVLAAAVSSAPHFGVDLKAQLSVAKFFDVFDVEQSVIKDDGVANELKAALSQLMVS